MKSLFYILAAFAILLTTSPRGVGELSFKTLLSTDSERGSQNSGVADNQNPFESEKEEKEDKEEKENQDSIEKEFIASVLSHLLEYNELHKRNFLNLSLVTNDYKQAPFRPPIA